MKNWDIIFFYCRHNERFLIFHKLKALKGLCKIEWSILFLNMINGLRKLLINQQNSRRDLIRGRRVGLNTQMRLKATERKSNEKFVLKET